MKFGSKVLPRKDAEGVNLLIGPFFAHVVSMAYRRKNRPFSIDSQLRSLFAQQAAKPQAGNFPVPVLRNDLPDSPQMGCYVGLDSEPQRGEITKPRATPWVNVAAIKSTSPVRAGHRESQGGLTQAATNVSRPFRARLPLRMGGSQAFGLGCDIAPRWGWSCPRTLIHGLPLRCYRSHRAVATFLYPELRECSESLP